MLTSGHQRLLPHNYNAKQLQQKMFELDFTVSQTSGREGGKFTRCELKRVRSARGGLFLIQFA